MSNQFLNTTGYSNQTVDINAVNPYTFVNEGYTGNGGFASGDYIWKFPRELSYEARKSMAVYKNYVKGIADSIIIPCFTTAPKRVTNNDIFAAFIENCDNNGTNLSSMTKTITKQARINSVGFAIMDNFEETPDLQSEVIEQRKYPYIYMKSADQCVDYDTNEFGNLQSITFLNGMVTHNEKKTQSYRVWDTEGSQIFIKVKGKYSPYSDKKVHGLGVVPVIDLRNESMSDGIFLPVPAFYDLVKLGTYLYNLDSEIQSLERNQAFSLLIIPSDSPTPNLELGSDSVIVIPTNSTIAPSFISPDSNIMKVLMERSKDTQDAILSVANVLGATAVSNNGTKSGVALAYEFLGQSNSLEHTSTLSEDFEERVSTLFGLYINQEIEYEVEYDTNFKPSNSEIKEKTNIIEQLSNLNLSDTINNQLKYIALDVVNSLMDITDEDFGKLKDMVAAESSDNVPMDTTYNTQDDTQTED